MEYKYHYVYRITNTVERKHYYGKRSSNIEPKQDIGIRYFSSSRDKNFILDQKENFENYKYKVVKVFSTSSEAIAYEVMLHLKFDVGVNPNFYNKSRQTVTMFDTTGVTRVGTKHTEETKKLLSEIAKNRIRKPHSEETKEKMRKNSGVTHHKSVLVNVYKYSTNEVIAVNVSLRSWCKEHNGSRNRLIETGKGKRIQHNDMYIRYVSEL